MKYSEDIYFFLYSIPIYFHIKRHNAIVNPSIIRVYTKVPGKEPDLNSPFVLPKESILEELAAKIHKDFVIKIKFAKIWGEEVFDGQMVQRDYVLRDGDVAEIHI